MKKSLFSFILLLLLLLISSNLIFSQDLIKERPDLKEEIIKLSDVLDFEEDELVNIEFTVYQFQGTVEEALVYVEETLLKNESKKIEMEYSENNLSEMLAGIRSLAEYGVISPLDEKWIEASKIEAEELNDRKQTEYYGYLEYPNLEKDISVESPYYNPATFRLEEGTYIIYSESKLTEADNNEIMGEKTELENKLAEEFFKGSWTIQSRYIEDEYDEQVPELTIRIDELVGSITEMEIEAERYLFSGQIEIEGEVYEAFSELDPVNIYAYPIRIISVLKEEGLDYQLEIWLEDIDNDLEISIYSDLEEVYEKAIGVDVYYDGLESSYYTNEEAVDYLIRE